jgi:hypothetical protein
MLHSFQNHLAPRMATLHLAPPTARAIEVQLTKLAGAEIPPELSAETRHQLRDAIDLSFLAGFRLMAVMAATSALASAMMALAMIRPDGRLSRRSTPR